MSCNHKFIDYLQLQSVNDFEPCTLIIGTFNPEWPATNTATWFYGRTKNNYFWDLLPRMVGAPGLRGANSAAWKEFCRDHKVAITDLVSCIEDANPGIPKHVEVMGRYTDSQLDKTFKIFIPNPIISILQKWPTITTVYLTTTEPPGKFNAIWQPVLQYCAANGIWCRQLMTPSKGARFTMTKGAAITMPDFIYSDWLAKWNAEPCKPKK